MTPAVGTLSERLVPTDAKFCRSGDGLAAAVVGLGVVGLVVVVVGGLSNPAVDNTCNKSNFTLEVPAGSPSPGGDVTAYV